MPSLNRPQAEFLQLDRKFRAYVGGFGSGKTWAGAAVSCRLAWESPRVPVGYFGPSFPAIRDIFYPTIEEVADDCGLRCDINQSNKEVHLYSGKQYRSTIICRSMDRPGDIVGFKIGHAHIDEIDVLPKEKGTLAWRKIIARLRHQNGRNGADVTTTPEGFRFAYQTFVKDARDKPERRELYGMVQASTYENEANLPEGYIESLRASYPPQLIDAYLEGRFVNLTSGAVYPDFSRTLNHTDARLGEKGHDAEPAHIGMDFNVTRMAAVVHVLRGADPHAVGELVDVFDTPAMIALIKDKYRGHSVMVYPDASGGSRRSVMASESDLSLLKAAGFRVCVNSVNPAVKDRVLSVNAMLNKDGKRRYKVNPQTCPHLVESLEKQAYDKNGEPDKTAGFDHVIDATGYFISYKFPIVKRIATVTQLRF